MSRSTHNVNYIYDCDGETVWEKLRVIRGFLEEKQIILQEIELKEEYKKEHNGDSFEYKKAKIHEKKNLQLKNELIDEIKFLEEFESWLAQEAEKTRIPGKTDEEMYEINFFEELKIRLIKRAQSQLIATGHIEPDTLQRIMKNSDSANLAIQIGLIDEKALQWTNSLPSINNNYNKLLYRPEQNKLQVKESQKEIPEII